MCRFFVWPRTKADRAIFDVLKRCNSARLLFLIDYEHWFTHCVIQNRWIYFSSWRATHQSQNKISIANECRINLCAFLHLIDTDNTSKKHYSCVHLLMLHFVILLCIHSICTLYLQHQHQIDEECKENTWMRARAHAHTIYVLWAHYFAIKNKLHMHQMDPTLNDRHINSVHYSNFIILNCFPFIVLFVQPILMAVRISHSLSLFFAFRLCEILCNILQQTKFKISLMWYEMALHIKRVEKSHLISMN